MNTPGSSFVQRFCDCEVEGFAVVMSNFNKYIDDVWDIPVRKYDNQNTYISVFELRADAEMELGQSPKGMNLIVESVSFDDVATRIKFLKEVAPAPVFLFLKDAAGKWARIAQKSESD